jgi:hypothetical protein
VFLQEVPPAYQEARASAEIALTVNPKHVKALYRRAQATLEDNREGLPEESLRAAHADLKAALEVEPRNAQISTEAERVQRRIAVIEEMKRVPSAAEIAEKIPAALLERGANMLDTHGYLWGQTEFIVHLFMPAHGVKGLKSKDAFCEVKPKFLQLGLPMKKGIGPGAQAQVGMGSSPDRFELFGPLHKPVRPDDCSWQLEDGGSLLHVELAKRDTGEDQEHWMCVWSAHPQTNAMSAKEKQKLQDMARAANRAESAEEKEQKLPPGAQEKLQKLREQFPDMPIEWGDTSLDNFKD